MTALLLLLLQSLSEPDLVIRNARIVTMDDSRPDAEALAIRGEHVVAVTCAIWAPSRGRR